MNQNQTAAELAHEYEQMAIAATNDYCRLKRHEPTGGFPMLAKQIGFCTTMHVLWQRIARQLAEGPEIYPQEGFHGNNPDGTVRDTYGEYGI